MRQFHSSNPEGLCDRCRQPIGQHISGDYFCPYYPTQDSDLTVGERMLNKELAKRTAERDRLRAALERCYRWMNERVGNTWEAHDAVDPTLWDELKTLGIAREALAGRK